jgi:trafficking protein particle complex subunit 3
MGGDVQYKETYREIRLLYFTSSTPFHREPFAEFKTSADIMSRSATTNLQRLGSTNWDKTPKVNGELFALTYGSMVSQIVKDYEEIDSINAQLEKMGHNIGVRLIDEFLAKSGMDSPCSNFKETAEMISKVAFRMFLNIVAECKSYGGEENSFGIVFNENPITEFVELPPNLQGLKYCNVLCGVIKGALEMIQMDVEAELVKEIMKGDDCYEIRITYKKSLKAQMNEDYADV